MITLLTPASDVLYAQDAQPRQLTLGLSTTILPDVDVTRATNAFCADIARQVGGVTIKSAIVDTKLDQLGADLRGGREFQLVAVWGIEYGWLQHTYRDLEILAVATEGNRLDTSSVLVVREDVDVAGSTPQNPLKLMRHRQESLVTQIHRFELDKKYKVRIRDSQQIARNVKNALINIQNRQQDGLLVDEYRLHRIENLRPLRGFRKLYDWGDLKKELQFPPVALIGFRDNINRGFREDKWEQIKSTLFTLLRNGNRNGRAVLRAWQAAAIVEPDQRYKENATRIAAEYRSSDIQRERLAP